MMRLTNTKYTLISIICIAILALSMMLCVNNSAYAETNLADGKYRVPFESSTLNDMGMMAFEGGKREVVVEKIGSRYYMTVSFDGSNIENVVLKDSNGAVGYTLKKDGNIMRYTYTISAENITRLITFKGHIIVMNKDKEFDFTLNFAKAERIGDADTTIERPAEYVPVLTTDINNAEVEKGSLYIIPSATAKLGSEDIPVTIKAYYMAGGKKIDVEIDDGKFVLNNAGDYYVVMRAESDKYKTSAGNNTFAEVKTVITAKVGASSLVKINDKDNILPANYGLQSNIIKSGAVYDKAATYMEKIADNFDVLTFGIVDGNGDAVVPTENVEIMLRCNDAYNRNEVEVYYIDDEGNISKAEGVVNYGRYLTLNTKNTGTYIICQPGVEFHMPMWAIATLTIVGAVLVLTAIIVPIVIVAKKKKTRLADVDTSTDSTDAE